MAKEKSKQTKSEIPSSKQPKENKETSIDYLEKKLKEAGIQFQRKELPKDWCRAIFKR